MKFWKYIWLLVLSFSSCGDELELITVQDAVADSSALSIEVSNRSLSKGLIDGLYMPEGTDIGVFLRNPDGSRYDGISLQSMKYSSVGVESEQNWVLGDKQAPFLSNSVATAYSDYE